MKESQLFIAIVVTIWSLPADANLSSQWVNFKQTHQKTYRNRLEEAERLAIFSSNLQKIEAHNKLYEKSEVSYTMAVNQFADLTGEEFKQNFISQKSSELKHTSANVFKQPTKAKIPDKLNWVNKGAVSYVKNQGSCGASWAFSAVGALEGQNYILNGELGSYSVQELLDCIHELRGCQGGTVEEAFEYITENGVSSAENYYYGGNNNYCRRANLTSNIKENGYALIRGAEDSLKSAVALIGPISASMHATMNFQYYEKGVFYDPDCKSDDDSLNLGVLVVGYGTTNAGEDFWLVKNSWGYLWGLEGYIKLARNRDNHCGLMTAAMYPIL